MPPIARRNALLFGLIAWLASLPIACSPSSDASPAPDAARGADVGAIPDAGPARDGAVAPPAWLEEASILVSGRDASDDCRTAVCRHNENTDLFAWKGAIWLVHRTAQSQILGPNCSLRILRSTDGGKTFTRTATIPAPLAPLSAGDTAKSGRDLRDPHFYVVGDRLFIKAITRLPVLSARDSNVESISVATFTTDGTTWSPLAPITPPTWSLWRTKENAGTHYGVAYEDGDKQVALFTSKDGLAWTKGATIFDIAADTPLETELEFLPSGRLLALVRIDGTDDEILGSRGRLRTKVCQAMPPYTKFDCPQDLTGERLDGPVSFNWKGRIFVVARKHLPGGMKKRTALFELTDTLASGPVGIRDLGHVPSAGDTAYAGVAMIDDHRVLTTWYSGDTDDDADWFGGMLDRTDIWKGVLDLAKVN